MKTNKVNTLKPFWAIFTILITLFSSCAIKKDLVIKSETEAVCNCYGEGKFTFVLDAGMGNWSLFYRPLVAEISKYSRVCTIDRPGYNMDGSTNASRDSKTIASEIDNALLKKGVNGNLILVGHSLGGLNVRMYQSLFKDKVNGLVLLDAAHPAQFEQLPKEFEQLRIQQLNSLDKLIKLSEKGYMKYGKKNIPTFGLPDSLLAEYYKVTYTPGYYYTLKQENIHFLNSLNQVKSLNTLNDLPLLVIGSKNSMNKSILPGKLDNYPFDEHNKKWLLLQEDLSKLSSNTTFVKSDADHYLLITDYSLVKEEISKYYLNHFQNK